MKKNQFVDIILIVLISIINLLIWKFFETPLNNENLQITGEISELNTSGIEIIKYGIISFFITIVMFLPFLRDKEFKPKMPYFVGILIMTIVFTTSGYLLDQCVKGSYLVGYLGDDFPFITRIIQYFMFFPIILYFLTTNLIAKIRKRTILGFFLVGLISAQIACFEKGDTVLLGIKNFRKVISGGHFLIWITLFIGIQFFIIKWIIKKTT